MLAKSILLAALASATIAAPALAGITSLDLANYHLTATYALPSSTASESSAITYNRDNGHLYVVGDEGDHITELTRTGQVVSSMALTGFADTEGLTYVGSGQFVIAEERIQTVTLIPYVGGSTLANSNFFQKVALGPNVGNVGIEGVSYDPLSGLLLAVKEKSPSNVLTLDVNNGNAIATLFNPASLGVADLSDIQVLTTVPSLIGTADQNNLLILSQESRRLLEVSRTGQILSTFDLSALPGNIEGVTIDTDGVIYLTGETPEMYVLTPIPAPGAAGLAVVGGLMAGRRRRVR